MDYESYASPFSWRYGRAPLRALYSEKMRRRLWRAVWVALAEAQSAHGLIEEAEVADLRAHAGDIDVEAAIAIEREIHHDLMAEIRVFAPQARLGGGKLHLGATSMDIEDTVETYRLRLGALAASAKTLVRCSQFSARRFATYAELVCMGVHASCSRPSRRRWVIGSPRTRKTCSIDDAKFAIRLRESDGERHARRRRDRGVVRASYAR